MPTENILERLHQATLLLCGDGSVKDRLADAYVEHLARLDLEQIPADMRIEFDALRTAMTRERPLSRESVARASVRKMSIEEACRLAAVIVRVYASVAQEQRGTRTQRNAERAPQRKARVAPATPLHASSPIVQLFAKES
ncbi:MAG: hypothetical protein LBE59_04295 [Nevskiaceae bacterium]|jgi:hypothetical protein|nr:hypothetical protein [Nevskiaceae bacterium]